VVSGHGSAEALGAGLPVAYRCSFWSDGLTGQWSSAATRRRCDPARRRTSAPPPDLAQGDGELGHRSLWPPWARWIRWSWPSADSVQRSVRASTARPRTPRGVGVEQAQEPGHGRSRSGPTSRSWGTGVVAARQRRPPKGQVGPWRAAAQPRWHARRRCGSRRSGRRAAWLGKDRVVGAANARSRMRMLRVTRHYGLACKAELSLFAQGCSGAPHTTGRKARPSTAPGNSPTSRTSAERAAVLQRM